MATDEVVDTIKTHIVRTPGVLGGKPRIAGRRIAVQHVAVWYEHMGMSVGDIVKEFDLSAADVHAALAYYYDHRAEIEGTIQAGEAFVEEMKQRYPSKLAEKLKAQQDG